MREALLKFDKRVNAKPAGGALVAVFTIGALLALVAMAAYHISIN